jgi:rare lipoprotein A
VFDSQYVNRLDIASNGPAFTTLTASVPTGTAYGTKVKVTNLRNGRSVVLRVNDRGPFVGGRIADLSQAAAAHIRMLRQGVAQAKLEVLGKAGAGGHTGHSAPHVARQPSAKPTRTPAH